MKFTGKNKKLIIEAVFIFILIAGASLAVDILYIQPQQSASKLAVAKGDYLQIVVNYVGGGSTTYYSNQQAPNKPLSITLNGKAVLSLTTNLYIIPTFTLGTGDSISSWSITGLFNTNLYQEVTPTQNGNSLYLGANQPLQPLWMAAGQSPQPSLVSGQGVEVASATLTASQIQALYSGWQAGTYYNFVNTFGGSATINFALAGAQTQSVSSITGTVTLLYTSNSNFSGFTANFAYS